MLKITLFAFGKLKTPGLRLAADHYQKRLKPWVNFEEIELKPMLQKHGHAQKLELLYLVL